MKPEKCKLGSLIPLEPTWSHHRSLNQLTGTEVPECNSMAKFLNTSGVTFYLEELIKNTKDKLILVSPYLQFNDRIKEHIQNLNIQKKDIRIIYRDNKLHLDENNWLASQVGVRTSICKTLHAKCYINDSEAIITSMNLYEFSQQNNNEMGIYLTKELDADTFNAAYDEVSRLLRISEEVRVTVQKVELQKSQKALKEKSGFCIRTGISIPFDIEKPLSADAFRKWNEYGDVNYPEKYCHFSGELSNGDTSVKQPILKKYWKRAKEAYNL